MSRSYKKTPVCQDGYGKKSLQWYKRCANKKVRRATAVADGKAYRKVYETWNFRDYAFRKTLNQYKIELESHIKNNLLVYGGIDGFPRLIRRQYKDKNFNWWKKHYYRK